ncbi:hypothetical protein C8R43DRAFT_1064339 [Mycena crocata]|nr:hypothetical protein C8R43DRAFT_1064339 [Mycena crocata]
MTREARACQARRQRSQSLSSGSTPPRNERFFDLAAISDSDDRLEDDDQDNNEYSEPEPQTAPLPPIDLRFACPGLFGPRSPDDESPKPAVDSGLPAPVTSSAPERSRRQALQDATLVAYSFFMDAFTRQLYLHLLLRIPYLYFSRVARIFEDAQFSLPEIKRMALDEWNSKEKSKRAYTSFLAHQDSAVLPPSLLTFRSSWEGFIDSLMREWKTFNIISVLLAILTMLQIDAAAHPITRTSALCSLICAFMSLLYGCMYIIRFGTMRKLHKANSFANEAQRNSGIWWNVWVLLAMGSKLAKGPSLFLTCIMSFIWLSGNGLNTESFSVSPHVELGLRIGLTVVFSLALVYFTLIVKTFHRYGDALDQEWLRTVNGWVAEHQNITPTPRFLPRGVAGMYRPSDYESSLEGERLPREQRGKKDPIYPPVAPSRGPEPSIVDITRVGRLLCISYLS